MDLTKTTTMLDAITRVKQPTTTLIDTFFPTVKTYVTETVEIETKQGGQKIAPFVVPGTKGSNLARTGSRITTYKAPIMKPSRVISASDIQRRGFGENVYSTKTPAERAMDIRANDLKELIDSCTRRQELMAAQLLLGGEYECKGVADDGQTELIDKVSFLPDFKNVVVESKHWAENDAKILDSIGDLSRTIRKATAVNPTVAICSYNVLKYLMANTQLKDVLMVPNRDNLALLSIQPTLVRPELLRVGRIDMLGLEIYVYDATYEDESGEVQQYIPDDRFIVGTPNLGKRYFGAVTQLEESDRQYHTYEGMYIPKYTTNVEDDVTTLAVSSRCVIAPDFVDSWGVIKCKG